MCQTSNAIEILRKRYPRAARHVETYRDGMADGRELERESIIAFIQELQEMAIAGGTKASNENDGTTAVKHAIIASFCETLVEMISKLPTNAADTINQTEAHTG